MSSCATGGISRTTELVGAVRAISYIFLLICGILMRKFDYEYPQKWVKTTVKPHLFIPCNLQCLPFINWFYLRRTGLT